MDIHRSWIIFTQHIYCGFTLMLYDMSRINCASYFYFIGMSKFIYLFSSGKWLFIILRQNTWWVLLHSRYGTICLDLQESGRIPSLESMKAVDPATMSSVEVIVVDRHGDPSLRELQNQVHTISSSSITTKEVVDQRSTIDSMVMGGA